MKKTCRIILLLTAICFISACSTSKKADKQLHCQIESDTGETVFKSVIVLDYDSSSDQVFKVQYDDSYTNLEKTATNNNILTSIMERQSKLSQIDGIEVDLDVQETSFTSKEVWDLKKVNPKDALEVDDEQAYLMEDAVYTKSAFQKHFQNDKGYSCY